MKKTFTIFLIMVLMMSLAACGGQDDSGTQDKQAGESYTITDMLGREVEIPADVNTIAAVNSAARFITYAGAADKLVGVTDLDKKGEPGMPYAYVNRESFADLASTGSGGSEDTTYAEELVTLAPDLIFAYTSDTAALDELSRQTGIPVVGLYATDMFAEDFLGSLTLVGSVMGTEEQADKVAEAIRGWQKDLSDRTKDIAEEDKPTVYMGGMGYRGPHGFEGTCALYPPFAAINAKNVVDETGQSGALLTGRSHRRRSWR